MKKDVFTPDFFANYQGQSEYYFELDEDGGEVEINAHIRSLSHRVQFWLVRGDKSLPVVSDYIIRRVIRCDGFDKLVLRTDPDALIAVAMVIVQGRTRDRLDPTPLAIAPPPRHRLQLSGIVEAAVAKALAGRDDRRPGSLQEEVDFGEEVDPDEFGQGYMEDDESGDGRPPAPRPPKKEAAKPKPPSGDGGVDPVPPPTTTEPPTDL